MTSEKNELATINTSLNALNLLDEKDLVKAEFLLKKLMSSEKGGIKSVADGIAILTRAQDLNLPFSTCIEHIHVINGKTGIDIHVIKALLARAGVVWECTKDYTPLYQYTDGNSVFIDGQLPEYVVRCKSAEEAEKYINTDKVGVYPLKYYADLKGNVFNEFQINEKCVIALNKLQAQKLTSEGKYAVMRIPAQPVDYVVEYKLTRYRNILGEKVITHAISHYSFSEAQASGAFDKDTYKKYPRIMISHRAFTLGARDIANDLLMGCMETTELYQVVGKDLTDDVVIDAEVVD